MVTDFQDNNYSTVYSNYELRYSEIEDEMSIWVVDFISELKSGIRRNRLKDVMAMCIYDTLISLSGDPAKDYISYDDMNRLIYNFNALTKSTVSINFR